MKKGLIPFVISTVLSLDGYSSPTRRLGKGVRKNEKDKDKQMPLTMAEYEHLQSLAGKAKKEYVKELKQKYENQGEP